MSEAPTYLHRPFSNRRKAFPRDNNELVDIDVYLDYLIDNPEDTPVAVSRNIDGWMYQHIYFQKFFYMQKGVSQYLKDYTLYRFCASPYNQLVMRRQEEQKMHKAFEEHVIVPPIESMEKELSDFGYLDLLGAAAIGRRISIVPEALGYLASGEGKAKPPDQAVEFSALERAEYFDLELEQALGALESPLVTPQRLITGAISRIGKLVNSGRLKAEAQRRIEADPIFYPVRLRHPNFYYEQSLRLLEGISLAQPVEDSEAIAA